MTNIMKRSNQSLPQQTRARATYEKLLTSTGELLAEVGFEKISSNRIAKNAGLTPPAFYRYFTDKYDILEALAMRLMQVQNQLILDVFGTVKGTDLNSDHFERLILATIDVTEDFPGGPWIMRSIRAVPALEQVRLKSHREMSTAWATYFVENFDSQSYEEFYHQARLGIEIGYASIELVFDEPELNRETIVHDCARAIALISTAIA